MASMNKQTIIGNVGADPEMRYTTAGVPVTNFSVAVNDTVRLPDGTTGKTTQWFRCSAWDRLAEVASQYLKKGNPVYIEGPLQVREYVGNDGQKRVSLDIVRVTTMQMLGGRIDPALSAEGTDTDGESIPAESAVASAAGTPDSEATAPAAGF